MPNEKCRTCLIESGNLVSVFSTRLISDTYVKYSEMIELCTGVNVSLFCYYC